MANGNPENRGHPPVDALQRASHAIRDLHKNQRVPILLELADGRAQPEQADRIIESLRWLNRLVNHTWRVVDSTHHAMI